MKDNSVHIGQAIKKKLAESGITKAELGRRTGIVPQSFYAIFKKSDIATDKLEAISNALGFNFFSLYCGSPDNKDQVIQELTKRVNDLEKTVGVFAKGKHND